MWQDVPIAIDRNWRSYFINAFATAMYAGKVTLDCIRAGMAPTATLSGSRRHSSARTALSQPRCASCDIHSPKRSEVKFSRHDGVRPSVGLHRKGSKSAIAMVATQNTILAALIRIISCLKTVVAANLRNASSDNCGLLDDDKLRRSRNQVAASFPEFLVGPHADNITVGRSLTGHAIAL